MIFKTLVVQRFLRYTTGRKGVFFFFRMTMITEFDYSSKKIIIMMNADEDVEDNLADEVYRCK